MLPCVLKFRPYSIERRQYSRICSFAAVISKVLKWFSLLLSLWMSGRRARNNAGAVFLVVAEFVDGRGRREEKGREGGKLHRIPVGIRRIGPDCFADRRIRHLVKTCEHSDADSGKQSSTARGRLTGNKDQLSVGCTRANLKCPRATGSGADGADSSEINPTGLESGRDLGELIAG